MALAAVIAMRTNVARMNEILEYPIQTGQEQRHAIGAMTLYLTMWVLLNSGEMVLKDVS